MQFSDQTPQWEYSVDSAPDPTFGVADTNDADLGNFFSRPIKTQAFSWGTGTTLFETFNPWNDYFENPRVINRITNYNLLRCKLKVRIMLNGNSFHYGRAIASYTPNHLDDNFTMDRAFFIQDVVAASQRPHVYLDPTTSQGGTLTLPFVYKFNALSIPYQKWKEMGEIIIHGMQDLKHANGASDSVTVSVFVWAEDVQLSIPTASEPASLVAQAMPMSAQAADEYGNGPISKPAGIIAKIAGALTSAPIIGTYARATEMAASAVSNVATMFGFSRPTVLADIEPYKPTFMGNMANTNVPDSCQKLTLDAKQELTIDPRTMGLGSTDEMTIASIAQRESWLTNFEWKVSDAAESLLWNTEVSPVLWNELNTEIHMPACCFAALPFRKWRGTMKFRFQIVASAFHKGRLKIVYDPHFPLTNEYNTNYTYIIDLAKEKDFTVDVGWGARQAMVGHRSLVNVIPWSSTKLLNTPGSSANGILSVYVVNDLTVPNSIANNDIEVNVFVSTGDDFEVFNPDSREIEDLVWFQPQAESRVYEPQSGGEHPDADLTKDEDEPMKMVSSATLATPLSATDYTSSVYYGDPIVSFRQCLKRYNYHTALSPQYTIPSLYRVRRPNFPFYRGYAPGAVHKTSTGISYNYCKTTLLNYLTPAYTCVRGGIRWKYLRSGGSNTGSDFMCVARDSSNEDGPYEEHNIPLELQSSSTPYERVRQIEMEVPHGWDGTAVTSTQHNPALEIELPYYVNDRFTSGKRADVTSVNASGQQYHQLATTWEVKDGESGLIHCYVSVGEDFTLGFFTGAPVAWIVTQSQEPNAQITYP